MSSKFQINCNTASKVMSKLDLAKTTGVLAKKREVQFKKMLMSAHEDRSTKVFLKLQYTFVKWGTQGIEQNYTS